MAKPDEHPSGPPTPPRLVPPPATKDRRPARPKVTTKGECERQPPASSLDVNGNDHRTGRAGVKSEQSPREIGFECTTSMTSCNQAWSQGLREPSPRLRRPASFGDDSLREGLHKRDISARAP